MSQEDCLIRDFRCLEIDEKTKIKSLERSLRGLKLHTSPDISSLKNTFKPTAKKHINKISTIRKERTHEDEISDLSRNINRCRIDTSYKCIYHDSDQTICAIYDCTGHRMPVQVSYNSYIS